MAMENLLAPSVLGIIIQSGATIIVALIARWGVAKAGVKPDVVTGGSRPGVARELLGWVVAGVTGAAVFSLFGLAYNGLAPKPTVAITNPSAGSAVEVQVIDTGSGSFQVAGNSQHVFDRQDKRVYVLLHPANPFAEGWWVQPAVIMNSDGSWSGLAWIGNKQSPPETGDLVDLMAIVASPTDVAAALGNRNSVKDVQDLSPTARSEIVEFTIAAVR